MSTQILIKRSTTTGAVPTTSDIAVGELAINTVDKRIFTNNSGTIVELGTTPTTQAVTGNASVGGTFDVVGAVTVGNLTADGTVDLTAATVTIPAPTADTHPATKKYVDDEVNAILDGAPAALNTLNEIAAAINDDANLYTTLTNSIATKLSLAGGTMTGSIDMGANSITTSADPATANTLTRKSYVDGLYQSTVDAEVSAANALASEQAAATSATNAATSATASATSATASASSATNAASSATAAASSATSAANSATASATSATQSAASATQAQALVDSIESFYLGAEASAPTVDDNGDPLAAGDWYFNTTDNATYIYNGSSWQSVSPDLVADLTPQLGGDLSTNGNDITFGDNDKAIFGAGSDLKIYHNGSASVISDTGTGNFFISGDNDVFISKADLSEVKAKFSTNGAVSLYYDNAEKLATTSTGIDVTGTATMDGAEIAKASSMTQLKLERTTTAAGSGYLGASADHCLVAQDSAGLYRAAVHQNGDLSLYEDTGTTAKFFWDASAERLGIGTSSPSGVLDIGDTGSFANVLVNSDVASGLASRIALGTTASKARFTIGYEAGTEGAYLGSEGSFPVRFQTGGSERMRLTSTGDLLVGKTTNDSNVEGAVLYADSSTAASASFTSDGIRALLVNRKSSDGTIIDIRKDGATVGSISTSGGTTSYNITSDYRLKENLVALTGAVDRIKELPVHQFNFIGHNKTVDGFLAHELQAVVPEAVTGIKDGLDEDGNPEYQAIDQSKLVPLLTAALQEALARIEALEAKLP